jgi:hypothetical protein
MAQDMHDIILDLSQNILLEQPNTNNLLVIRLVELITKVCY